MTVIDRRVELAPALESQHLEELRRKFDGSKGDKRVGALFSAIRFCGNQRIALPEWVMDEFFRATNAWFRLRAGSLDEAFGAKALKPDKARRIRHQVELARKVVSAIDDAQKRGKDVSLRELAGELGASKSVVHRLKRNLSRDRK